LPRFVDFGGAAETAAREGVEGGIRSALSITRAACLADSTCDTSAATATVAVDGATINLVFGYPAATAAGIQSAAQLDGVTITTDGTATPPTLTATIDTDCTVIYTEAANATTAPTLTGDAT